MEETKIQFSPHEIRLMSDPGWILTKNAVIAKLYEGMGNLARRMEAWVRQQAHKLPPEFARSNAKISRGENYQGLPYVMLDYPKVFGRDNVLAIRTFFWWGRYCTITLHTKGRYKEPVLQRFARSADTLAKQGFYASTAGDEWSHDLSSTEYEIVTPGSGHRIIEAAEQGPFFKLAAKTGLNQWEEMEAELYASFVILAQLCAEQTESFQALAAG